MASDRPGLAAGAARSAGETMRLLHIADSATGGEGAVIACGAGATLPGAAHVTWLLGVDQRLARLAGLGAARHMTITAGVPETAVRAAWRALAGRAAPDVVIAWSPGALHLATMLFGSRVPVVGVMPVAPAGVEGMGSVIGARWLRRGRMPRRGATIVPLGASLEAAWGGALGLGVTAVTPPWDAVAGPGASGRRAARSALGIGEGELAVLLLADPPSHGDVRRFVQVLGLVQLANSASPRRASGPARVVGLAHAASAQWGRAMRFAHANRRAWGGWDTIRFDGPTLGALAAADICVWDPAAGQGPVLALVAAAWGVPVIAREAPMTREVAALGAGEPIRIASGGSAGVVRGVYHGAHVGDERLYAAELLRVMAEMDAAETGDGGAAARSRGTSGKGPDRFHAELLDALRIITSTARTTAEWWDSVERGAVA